MNRNLSLFAGYTKTFKYITGQRHELLELHFQLYFVLFFCLIYSEIGVMHKNILNDLLIKSHLIFSV